MTAVLTYRNSPFFRLLGALFMLVGLSGCYMSGGIGALDPASGTAPSISKPLSRSADFVSGSGEYETTFLKKYKILSAAGGYNSQVVTKTTRVYKIYTSVIGSMLSKELDH